MKNQLTEMGAIVITIILLYFLITILGKADYWKELVAASTGGYFGYMTHGFVREKSTNKKNPLEKND